MPFFPKDQQFFGRFEKSAQNVLETAQLLERFFFQDHGLSETDLKQIEDREHTGDEITHSTVELLNKTFITPIDREDIYALICKLDDILDFIYGVANRMVLYKIGKPGREFGVLAGILVKAVEGVAKTVLCLREIKKMEVILAHCLEVGRLENQADDAHRRAVANLFETEKNPVQIIKIKEILDHMETATDKCQDVADVVEGIAVKYA